MNNLFIVDVDHTIINTTLIRQQLISALAQESKVSMDQALARVVALRQKLQKFTMRQFVAAYLEKSEEDAVVQAMIDEHNNLNFLDFYYEGAIEALKTLKNLGKLVIYSQGEEDFQRRKIQPLVDLGLIQSDHVFIHEDKKSKIAKFLTQFRAQKIFVFDDHKHYLAEFVEVDSKITTILVETQETADDGIAADFRPAISAKTFAEAVNKVVEIINGQ